MNQTTALPCIDRRCFVQRMMAMGFASQAIGQGHSAHARIPSPKRIMIDAYHSHTWIDSKPSPELYNYHKLHGLARAVARLQQSNYQTELQLVGPWTEKILSKFDAIFLNLVSVDQPPFYVDEIGAIKRYIENGGGLVLITDHSNCYYHAHVLAPLLRELGIEVPTTTSCDDAPQRLSQGASWLAIQDFADHPVARGISTVGFQTGGCVDSRYAIAWTSPRGWADLGANAPYGEGVGPGLYGDLYRSPAETMAKQGVILARTIERGRVAIIADQNALGNIFLGYADNMQLFLNAIAWAAKAEMKEPIKTQPVELGRKLVWCYEPLTHKKYHFGNTDADGFYHWYAWMTRYFDPRATDRIIEDADLLVVMEESLELGPEVEKTLVERLEKGMNAMVVSNGKLNIESLTASNSQSKSRLSKLLESGREDGNDPSEAEKAKTDFNPPIPVSCWILPLGNRLYWVEDRSKLSNQGIGPPEKEPNASQRAWESQLGNWMSQIMNTNAPASNKK